MINRAKYLIVSNLCAEAWLNEALLGAQKEEELQPLDPELLKEPFVIRAPKWDNVDADFRAKDNKPFYDGYRKWKKK